MSDTFLDRLKYNRLTNVEQYQQMKKANSVLATEKPLPVIGEEWKSWQLAPVLSDSYSVASRKSSEDDKRLDGALLQRALHRTDASDR